MSDKSHIPPPFSLWLIRKFCKTTLAEEIEGNLYEYYDQAKEKKKLLRAFRYWYEVFNYLRPSFLKIFKFKKQAPMFTWNPKFALRNLLKHRLSTFISLFGFIIGLVSVIFLYFYIENELNYDTFHINKDNIYRVKRISQINGSPYDVGVSSGPYARALQNDYSGTIQSTNRVLAEKGLISFGDHKFYEDKMLFTDVNFFEFFSFPLITGDPKTVLLAPNSVVISKKLAKKYFGDRSPMGEVLTVDNEETFAITGVMDDFPGKSHIEFEMVFSISLFESQNRLNKWRNNNLITYLNINTPEEAEYLKTLLPEFMDKYFGEDFKRYRSKIGLTIEPLTAIYFNSNIRYDPAKHGDKNNVIILGLVAIAILFIACFNYINLSIAQSYQRAKEVGIRKVLGVNQSRLMLQFLGEAIIIMFFAMLMAILLSEFLRPGLNNFFGLHVIFKWSDVTVLYFCLGLMSTIIITSGLYPALLLSSFKPLNVLKGGKLHLNSNFIVRKGLVITQFAVSVFLMIATMFISIQLNYMKNKGLGYDQNAIVLVDNNNAAIRDNQEAFKEALLRDPTVLGVSSASGEPGGFHDASSLQFSGLEQKLRVRTVFADPDYLKTFDIKTVAGRGFDRRFSTEEDNAMMINERALQDSGLPANEIIGKKVVVNGWDLERTIVGIFQDYHLATLKEEIEPLAIVMGGFHRRYAIKINGYNPSQALGAIEEIYRQFSPDFPISYEFQDDILAKHYIQEEKQTSVFIAFSGISIFLACMGIFGLAANSAQKRQKELGIRKILGANVRQIIALISGEFLILVGFSILVAIPLSWFFMENWLQDFAFRIRLVDHWMVFLIAGIITAMVAFLTIIIKTYKTAASKPIESIRYE